MKKNKSATELEKEELQKRLQDIKEMEEKELSEKHLPKFKKKFEGTAWVCPLDHKIHSDASGTLKRPKTIKWNRYYFIEEVMWAYKASNGFISAAFKGYCMEDGGFAKGVGQIYIHREDFMYVHSLEATATQCDLKEFLGAKQRIVDTILQIKPTI